MGCGASVSEGQPDGEQAHKEAPAHATWATKNEPSSVGADSGVNSLVKGARGGLTSNGEKMRMLDADDEEPEIEMIYEGKANGQKASQAANGQEAMEEAMELEDAKAAPIASEAPVKPPLSKQQQEEAAKLAEMRKRFDSQRYQRDGNTSPTAADAPAAQAAGLPASAPEAPKLDLVMGLNLADEPRGGGMQDAFDVMPGAIFDTPREEVSKPATLVSEKNRSKHDSFDDDDEMLMKEILESIDT